jgi:multiple sugar transport system substrate-binding protein
MRWNLGLTIFVAGLSLVLVVTLARPQPRSAQVDLVVWDWWSPSTTESYKAYFDDLAREFRTQHPEIQLRFQFIPFSNYPQKLTTGFAGRRPPDVFQCSVSWAETLYDRGVIRELNDLVERTPQLAMDQFLPAAVRHNQKNGRIFGIPIILDANCLIYNIDLFEQLGLPTDPHAIDSWETFLEFCRKLTVLDESGRVVRAGFGMNSFRLSAGIFHPWLYADGGKFYNEASGRAVFDSPEGIEAARFLLLLRDQKVVPPFSPQLDIQEQFIAGKIAMYIDGTWSGKYIERNSEGRARFAMTNLPPGPHGHGRTTVTWANIPGRRGSSSSSRRGSTARCCASSTWARIRRARTCTSGPSGRRWSRRSLTWGWSRRSASAAPSGRGSRAARPKARSGRISRNC